MQILGLSDSTPRSESRFKTLFWPSIRHEYDVDHVTRQGFWICLVVAIATLVFGFFQESGEVALLGGFEAIFFFSERCRDSGTQRDCSRLRVSGLLPHLISGEFFGDETFGMCALIGQREGQLVVVKVGV
jgi:hypothetical protein